jgi:hypothetical protein
MKFPLKILSATFLSFIFLNVTAAEKIKPEEKNPVAKIGREESINSEGIKIRVFKDATARPLLALSMVEKIKNGYSDTFEYYNILDLWTHDQFVGSWGCKDGKLTIYKVLYNVPAFKNEIVLKNNYEFWRNKNRHEWNDDYIIEWIRYLTGDKISDTSEQLQKNIPAKCSVKRYHMKNASDDLNSYLYFISISERPGDRYVLLYEISKNADSYKSEKTILQSLQSISFFPPKKTADKNKQKAAAASVRKRSFSSDYAANRESVIKNIKNLKNWWYLETENYIIASNLKNKKTINELPLNLEKCRSVYRRYYPQNIPIKETCVCKVFENRNEYVSYVGDEYKWSGGIWIPDKKELVISPAVLGKVSERRNNMMDLVYHEAFHQYLFYATDEGSASVWFNEGNACYFEGIDFKPGGKMKINLVPCYYEPMKKLALSGKPKVESLINMAPGAFYEGKDVNYAFAWGLLFFLHKGAPLMKDKNTYSEIPLKYYNALIELKNEEEATAKAWEGVDMTRFNRDFQEFWRNYTMIKRADEYSPFETREKAASKSQPSAQAKRK